jgi:hypothetical protein
MPSYTLQYIHLYIFRFEKDDAVALFEQIVSYYPDYNVGDEITFITSEEHDLLNRPTEVETYIVREKRSIITTDKLGKHLPQHTLYIRVSEKVGSIDSEYNDTFNIDYLIGNISPN